jgi:two-component system, NtrC family, response regulator HydG
MDEYYRGNMKSQVLIVDDEKSIRVGFKALLSEEGYEVITAKDYDSAVKAISKTDPDLIIADIILGGHTGIDLLYEVKNRGLLCPIIIITGEPNIDTSAEAVRLGAFDYIPKPIRKETLLRRSRHALSLKKLLDKKKQLELANEKYRIDNEAIFRSLKDAVITVDNNLNVIKVNEAIKTICRISPGEIMGKNFDQVPTGCNKACISVLKNTLKTKKTIKELRIECRHPDQTRQVVLLTSSSLLYRNNNPCGAVLVIRDITRVTDLESQLKERHRFHSIVGKSKKMQGIYTLIEDLSDIDSTILITGETGTGKELVADAIHNNGIRREKPFVKVNCSALSENLLESELFGHVKGAFTGAVKNKQGRFQMADGGTIFLDEIGEISPLIQLKLLRFLQGKEFECVGDSKPRKVDVRIIAATNCNLKDKVKKGEFREDLYYRINVVDTLIPPLRERREDIPLLADHFFNLFALHFRKKISGMSSEVMNALMNYSWPGNIRELEHTIEHAFVLCKGSTIILDNIPWEIQKLSMNKPVPENQINKKEILLALNKADWNKSKAARLLGIGRRSLYRKIDNYKIIKTSK